MTRTRSAARCTRPFKDHLHVEALADLANRLPVSARIDVRGATRRSVIRLKRLPRSATSPSSRVLALGIGDPDDVERKHRDRRRAGSAMQPNASGVSSGRHPQRVELGAQRAGRSGSDRPARFARSVSTIRSS